MHKPALWTASILFCTADVDFVGVVFLTIASLPSIPPPLRCLLHLLLLLLLLLLPGHLLALAAPLHGLVCTTCGDPTVKLYMRAPASRLPSTTEEAPAWAGVCDRPASFRTRSGNLTRCCFTDGRNSCVARLFWGAQEHLESGALRRAPRESSEGGGGRKGAGQGAWQGGSVDCHNALRDCSLGAVSKRFQQ